ncbi:DUF4307 domain-containing protein [Xylanimonas oleitrophica]|uniref:DUF4307 domain-containing protein n=1 Tax=Xylanimonas oleitrophica TaxID=2607479 RepID=A0A2W5X1V4_9MICO|nr:DUF4307 domain-containing protein [Xylanimonas oleitrophica]PZR54295.1 DUF4307 domain-containing protein [Xylanimonas oleitrophica]
MSTPTPPTPPADRYGRGRRTPAGRGEVPPGTPGGEALEPDDGGHRGPGLSRGAKAAAAAAIAVAVAAVAWIAASQHQQNPVTGDVVSYRVVSAEEVEIDFQVSMPVGTTAVCTVEAMSSSFAQVGTMDVEVGPSETRTSRYSVTLRTSQQADTGVVEGCRPA